uniref:FAS1 domain-containing protein n=1 Tax=Megaselia scalaris TaxID=36166 RepID=T1H2B4_MEGSC
RFLNNAEIAPYISGANYTFFVPEDQAFRNLGFDRLSDEIFSSPQGVKLLLHHFVRGRLYDRDLKDNEVFETIGGGIIKITRTFEGTVSVNTAKIVESEVFVYNLGTMFYIDSILYPDILQDYISKKNSGHELAGRPPLLPTPSDVEIVPKEFYVTEPSDSEDDEIITPKALPVRFMYNPKYKI